MGERTINYEATKKHKAIERDIGNIAECIGDVRKYLTLVHAFGGCEVNCKLSMLKFLDKSKAARRKADVFLQKGRTPETICEAVIRILVTLYCGKGSDSLTDLAHLKYIKMALSSRTVKP